MTIYAARIHQMNESGKNNLSNCANSARKLRIMTSDQLEHLRKSRRLTRAQLAQELGDCSASTVVNWESGRSPVPAWVEDKMLQSVRVELPLAKLYSLYALAARKRIPFEEMLSDAISQYVESEAAAVGPVTSREASLHSNAPGQLDARELDEAMRNQTERNKRLLERASAPPALRALPDPEKAAGEDTHTSGRKKRAQ
jgi:DNA-binding transcriptional regulator YiaG